MTINERSIRTEAWNQKWYGFILLSHSEPEAGLADGSFAYHGIFERKLLREGMPQVHSMSCLVDAHVHPHPSFPFETVLKAAARNFTAAVKDFHLGQPVTGVLMLTECAGVNAFAQLAEGWLNQ